LQATLPGLYGRAATYRVSSQAQEINRHLSSAVGV